MPTKKPDPPPRPDPLPDGQLLVLFLLGQGAELRQVEDHWRMCLDGKTVRVKGGVGRELYVHGLIAETGDGRWVKTVKAQLRLFDSYYQLSALARRYEDRWYR